MKRSKYFLFVVSLILILVIQCLFLPPSNAQRMMEKIDRAVVAIPLQEGNIYLGWRLLGSDPDDIAFNVYRTNGGQTPIKLNEKPLTKPPIL